MARKNRLPVLWRLRDDKQHLTVVIDADASKLERRKLRSEVRPKPILELVRLDAARDSRHAALPRTDDENCISVKVARGLLRTTVCGSEEKLRNLRNACLAAQVQIALDFEKRRLRLVADADEVLEDA